MTVKIKINNFGYQMGTKGYGMLLRDYLLVVSFYFAIKTLVLIERQKGDFMSIFNHSVAYEDIKMEIKVREMQKVYLEGLLELKKEELDADFDNLVDEIKVFEEDALGRNHLLDRIDDFRTSVSNFNEVRAELLTTIHDIEYAKGEEKEEEE